jgi:DNA helicase II / ATP-dependent DNA helicase PcrA
MQQSENKNIFFSFLESLNASQSEAVMFKEGSLLVIAGAGSGKTRTLTCRVARLVGEGVLPQSILLLTFTRKSASEMLGRAKDLLDERCQKVSGGTFHSFAHTILRRYSREIGFPEGYAIIDRPDAEDLISMIKKEKDFTARYPSFPTKKTIMDIFSRSANKMLPIRDIMVSEFSHLSSVMEGIILLYEEYKKQKNIHALIDYDDLLIHLKNLLHENKTIREKLSSSYRYIMVDEYQDTNKVQAEILYLLSSVNKNVMVVGDDSQSIYAFRGAHFKNIINFPKFFPGSKIIRLEENYRSVQPILTLTNAIIERASEKYSKCLFTKKTQGTTPLLVEAADEISQSRYVIDGIYDAIRKGLPLKDIAVLVRAGYHSFGLEIELTREGIAYNKAGGFKFMESAHIKDFLAHLRIICHPGDRLSWQRVFLLIDTIGSQKAGMMYESISREKKGWYGLIESKFAPGIEKHLKTIREMYEIIHNETLSVSEMGEIVFRYYAPVAKKKFDDYPKRIKDLEQLLTIMERYRNLEEFIADMVLEPPNTSSENGLETGFSNEDRLTISTIHSAKGLEWHTVFVIWALDGRFPSIHAIGNEDSLEEERRLMYVAATRARENLFFTYPVDIYDRAERVLLSHPSRFLAGMDETILKQIVTG